MYLEIVLCGDLDLALDYINNRNREVLVLLTSLPGFGIERLNFRR